jgi:dTDP-4-amino-4,6-dideoxygalactose transaminase
LKNNTNKIIKDSSGVPFYDSARVHEPYQKQLEKALLDALNQGDYIQGKAVRELESQLSEYLKISHTISCANGSEALTIALKSLDLPTRSEVIIPSFNYVSAAESAHLLGFKVVFCDVDLADFNVDLNLIKEKVSPKTKAIIVTHLFGKAIKDIAEIAAFCKENNIFLIEDNAQSFGSELDGGKAGTFGDISTTSFFPTKNLACLGDGGAIFTDDEALATKIRALCNHGQRQKYHFDFAAYNSRLDTIQAQVLKVKLQFLAQDLELRKANAKHYFEGLKDCKSIVLPNFVNHTFNQFTIRILDGKRDVLTQKLKGNGISTMIYYPKPMHHQTAFESLEKVTLPNTELLMNQVLSLPIFPRLTAEEISYICQFIKEICE